VREKHYTIADMPWI